MIKIKPIMTKPNLFYIYCLIIVVGCTSDKNNISLINNLNNYFNSLQMVTHKPNVDNMVLDSLKINAKYLSENIKEVRDFLKRNEIKSIDYLSIFYSQSKYSNKETVNSNVDSLLRICINENIEYLLSDKNYEFERLHYISENYLEKLRQIGEINASEYSICSDYIRMGLRGEEN